MAEDRKFGNLYIPKSAWWALRERFSKTLPSKVSQSYLANALNIQQNSAKNLVSAMRSIGLIDDDGKPTDLANRWRNDADYHQVCEEIRDSIYPQELRDLYSQPDSDVSHVKNWFKSKFGLGENTAVKLARFYVLLLKADPNQAAASGAPRQPKVVTSLDKKGNTKTRPTPKGQQADTPPPQTSDKDKKVEEIAARSQKGGLSLHIDLQIHISPEASPEQIDKLFESMAKHLPFNK